jgi:hypothetical protein
MNAKNMPDAKGGTLIIDQYRGKSDSGHEVSQTGTSIFDPVLCELAYRWFCPPGGTVLDPFAGGSVRGIVAAMLGYEYVGIDLSERQIQANREQAEAICGNDNIYGDYVKVNISSKWARHKFKCSLDYIKQVCGGRCCQGSDKVLISLLPSEEQQHIDNGKDVQNGLLQPDPKTGQCPYKGEHGLCSIHGSEQKPFGCIASPFTLNKGNTLIVRDRYTKLKCHGEGQPAYHAFRGSLDLLFGADEAQRIVEHLDNGGGDIAANMPVQTYNKIKYLDKLKHGVVQQVSDKKMPVWHIGDSRDMDQHCSDVQADFIFSCPPYADLEVYSDDERDLSKLEYADFITAYKDIIAKAASKLRDNRFACFVVGEVRDKRGNYYGFVPDTIQAFRDAGLEYYNEAILVTAVGSLPIRAGRQFQAGRKLGKTHQNILVFVKGNAKQATQAIGDVEFGDTEVENDRKTQKSND